MKKKILILAISISMVFTAYGCGNKAEKSTAANDTAAEDNVSDEEIQSETADSSEEAESTADAEDTTASIDLPDGNYMVKFDTDNSMFHVNEMMDGRALLTVENGKGNLHLVMPSKNVLNLYPGLASDAENDADNLLNPSVEEVTYDDGLSEEVFAFDVPVNVIDEEFDLALIGKKEVWYDHKVIISDPQPADEQDAESGEDADTSEEVTDGTIEVSLEGGTGKVTLISPTAIVKTDDGYLLTLEWSSKNYDYMIVADEKYLPVETGEHSIFEIPIKSIDEPLSVIADTVAMSTPHEIEYTISFDKDSMK